MVSLQHSKQKTVRERVAQETLFLFFYFACCPIYLEGFTRNMCTMSRYFSSFVKRDSVIWGEPVANKTIAQTRPTVWRKPKMLSPPKLLHENSFWLVCLSCNKNAVFSVVLVTIDDVTCWHTQQKKVVLLYSATFNTKITWKLVTSLEKIHTTKRNKKRN